MKKGEDALITVRVASSRLKAKCLLEFGSQTVLEHVVERALWGGFNPVICTTNEPEDDRIVSIAEDLGARYFRGDVADKLVRWRNACRRFEIVDCHTIDADDPFFDPELGMASLQVLRHGNLDMVYPAATTFVGSVGYSLTRDVIERACALKDSDDTEMMWYYIERLPGLKATILEVAAAPSIDARLTLDYEEDYWLLRSLLRILGPRATRAEIEGLFLTNPRLGLVNWFRNEQWQAGQQQHGG